MPLQRKLFDHATKPLDKLGEGVLDTGWRQACLLVRWVGDIEKEVEVIGMLEGKLLINDSSKKASFL